jgi:hypothetical protein
MDFGATLESTVLQQAVQFLFAQAGEILSAWRKRRKDPAAPEPTILETPPGVTVGTGQTPRLPADRDVEDALHELRESLEPVVRGEIDPGSPEARAAADELRRTLEAVLGAPITIGSEDQRTVTVEDVKLRIADVQGDVAGVRAALDKLAGQLHIKNVQVDADSTAAGSRITGADLS